MLFTFILAEAELELVPPEMQRAPSVVARARRRRLEPRHLLLDQAQDRVAMARLSEHDRRGRPDLAQVFLLLVQDSLLTKRGLTRVLIHTRHDDVIHVRADTRVPRNQEKLYHILEDLFRKGAIPEEDPLFTLERGRDLPGILEEAAGARVLLDERGQMARTGDFTALARESEDVTIVFGGFPRGAFRTISDEDVDFVLKVAEEPLSLWSALVPVLAGLEDAVVE